MPARDDLRPPVGLCGPPESNGMSRHDVAVICGDSLGWQSLFDTWRRRSREDQDLQFVFMNIAEHDGLLSRAVRKTGRFISLWSSLSARAAALVAARSSDPTIIIGTFHYTALLPRLRTGRYFVYGDATARQLDALGWYAQHQAERGLGVRSLLQAGIRGLYFRIFDRAIHRLARDGHQFLCMSDWYARGLAEEYGIAADQITVIPPCVDTNFWKPRDSMEAKDGPMKIIFIGGDFMRKGGDILLQACSDPRLRECEFHFVTRQRPPYVAENSFFHHDMKSNSDALVSLLRSCDVFVLPTRADCSSLASLEAGACGLPAIVSNVGGLPELVEHGKTGYVLDQPTACVLADRIFDYCQDEQLRHSHAKAARERVLTHYDSRVILNRLKSTLHANGPQSGRDG